MKSIVFGIALIGIPAIAIAQTGTKTPAPAPGQSEFRGDGDRNEMNQRQCEPDGERRKDRAPPEDCADVVADRSGLDRDEAGDSVISGPAPTSLQSGAPYGFPEPTISFRAFSSSRSS